MKGRRKKYFIGSAIFVFILTVWILANSIDEPSYDDKGLLAVFKPVPDNENGYLGIAHFGDEDFYKKTGIDAQKLRDMANGKTWDLEYIEQLVKNNKKLIADVKASTEKPHFKLPEAHGMTDSLYAYERLFHVWRLLILKSKLEANKFQFDDAIGTLELAINSVRKIQSEESHYLISYCIAIAGYSRVLEAIHALVTNYPLEEHQYKKLLHVINNIEDYKDDGFREVWSGEFRLYSELDFEYKNKNVFERIQKSIDMVKKQKESYDWLSPKLTVSETMAWYSYEFMKALFPAYYFHPNAMNNKIAPVFKQMQEQSQHYCLGANLSREEGKKINLQNPEWLDIIRPNSFTEIWMTSVDDWSDYFERRCLHHVYVESMKTIVAIYWHGSRFHKLPNNLSELVPDYLDEVPIDVFTGEPLHYSAEDEWLYSVGTDYQSDHGDMRGKFRGGCSGAFDRDNTLDKKVCETNPTVPIDWNDYQNIASKPANP